MLKSFQISIAALVALAGVLNGCASPEDSVEPTPYETEITARLDAVGQSLNLNYDGTENVDFYFDVFVDRADLGLTEPDTSEGDLSLSDLSLAQQIDVLIAKDSSTDEYPVYCQPYTAPHRCDVAGPGIYLLEVIFLDGATAETTIDVPEPLSISRPEILAPSELPAQGETFAMTFQDTGATTYNASVELCHPYQNDGINPCLEGSDFSLFKEEATGEWVLESSFEDATLDVDSAAATVHLSSGLILTFEDSIRYSVCGILTGTLEEDIRSYVEACDLVEFVR